MAARCPTPFAFPFTPLGLSLFDIDPSRILSMLHHQTWLAEEALRNRGMLTTSKDFTQRTFSTLGDLTTKDFSNATLQTHANTAELHANATSSSNYVKQQQQQQRSIPLQTQYKQQHPFNIPYPSTSLFYPQTNPHQQQQQHQNQQHPQQQQQQKYLKPKSQAQRQSTPSPHRSIATSSLMHPTNHTGNVLVEELRSKSNTSTPQADDASIIELSSPSETGSSSIENLESAGLTGALHFKDSLEQLLQRRHGSDASGIRSYTQLLFSNSTKTPPSFTDTSSCREKSSSSSTSSTPPPPPSTTSSLITQHQQLSRMLKSPSDSSLLNEPIEEETRCVVCNAHFPNVWLLEQHAALQHPLLGPGEEKPFICEQCGQSYRYRSAYAKHKEQNHRARLPADKLFTCDVCGMQFRYLKSFKKHRLNHALERLHGKKGSKYTLGGHADHEMVTSSQETMIADEGEDLRISIKRERDDDENERERNRERVRDEHAENEQDSTIDSAGLMHYNDNNSTTSNSTNLTEHNISSTDVINSSNKRHRLLTTPHLETDPSYQHHLQQQLTPHLQTTTMSPSMQTTHPLHAAATTSLNSLNSLNSITSLINAERLPSEQFLGLNPQEASILNFLRVDAAERQRDKRPLTSRFACPFCGKCVRSKENLKLHVRKHTGERPFVCLFCGRAFGGKSDLTRHLRIHTGERPYHCESCGKCFARADYLSKHLTTHVHNAPR